MQNLYHIKRDNCKAALNSDLIDVSNVKNMRINLFSDQPCMFYFYFYNRTQPPLEEKPLYYKLVLIGNEWRSERMECPMRYLRVVVPGQSFEYSMEIDVKGKTNNSKHEASELQKLRQDVEQAKLDIMLLRELQAQPKPSSNILKRFSPAKRPLPPLTTSSSNNKLPELILENTLLVGDKYNRTKCLAKGNPGEVLTVSEYGDLMWQSQN